MQGRRVVLEKDRAGDEPASLLVGTFASAVLARAVAADLEAAIAKTRPPVGAKAGRSEQ